MDGVVNAELSMPHQEAHVVGQGGLVPGAEQGLHRGVRHRHAKPDRDHRFPSPRIQAGEHVEERLLRVVAVVQKIALDTLSRGTNERVQDRRVLVQQASDVQDTLDASAERIADRRSGAGEVLE